MAAILEQSIILPWRFRMFTDLKCARMFTNLKCTRTVYNITMTIQNAYWPKYVSLVIAAILEQSIILSWRFRMLTDLKCASAVMAAILEQSIILPWWFKMFTDLKCASLVMAAILEVYNITMTIQNAYWSEVC